MTDPSRRPPERAPDRTGPDLTGHIAQSVDELADFHVAHYRSASRLQRLIDRLTASVATPSALLTLTGGLTVCVAAAVVSNPEAESPSGWLDLVTTCGALLVAVLILVTQRREDQLAERRGQLTLELAILADKKSAKIIALLEELRRDHPNVQDRIDVLSDEMAIPTDVPTVLAAIDLQAGPGAAPSD